MLISARSEDALNRACDEISTKTGGTVDAFPADVSVVSDLDALTAFVRERYNRVDVLVNNAGTGTYKSFFEVTDDDLEYGMAINFFAVPPIAKAGADDAERRRHDRECRRANRINRQIRPAQAGPAKAAELRFTADLADELRPHKIVKCVVPGVVITPDRLKVSAKPRRRLRRRYRIGSA